MCRFCPLFLANLLGSLVLRTGLTFGGDPPVRRPTAYLLSASEHVSCPRGMPPWSVPTASCLRLCFLSLPPSTQDFSLWRCDCLLPSGPPGPLAQAFTVSPGACWSPHLPLWSLLHGQQCRVPEKRLVIAFLCSSIFAGFRFPRVPPELTGPPGRSHCPPLPASRHCLALTRSFVSMPGLPSRLNALPLPRPCDSRLLPRAAELSSPLARSGCSTWLFNK